mmetsp:Transcript_7312/g.31076  ORF Transcript_7312/g.31076 Transcript_7312/m.31076 type:complete len:243 (-) Transcript_7312:1426-2154(-)
MSKRKPSTSSQATTPGMPWARRGEPERASTTLAAVALSWREKVTGDFLLALAFAFVAVLYCGRGTGDSLLAMLRSTCASTMVSAPSEGPPLSARMPAPPRAGIDLPKSVEGGKSWKLFFLPATAAAAFDTATAPAVALTEVALTLNLFPAPAASAAAELPTTPPICERDLLCDEVLPAAVALSPSSPAAAAIALAASSCPLSAVPSHLRMRSPSHFTSMTTMFFSLERKPSSKYAMRPIAWK